jgi:integrase
MATAILTTIPTGSSSPPTAPPSAMAIVARAGGEALPSYVTAEQARAVIDAAETTQHRLLLECLWQSGGRVSGVLRLRRCDVDQAEGALVLENLKQRRRERRRKLVDVSSSLIAALQAYCRDARLGPTAPLFGWLHHSGKSVR